MQNWTAFKTTAVTLSVLSGYQGGGIKAAIITGFVVWAILTGIYTLIMRHTVKNMVKQKESQKNS